MFTISQEEAGLEVMICEENSRCIERNSKLVQSPFVRTSAENGGCVKMKPGHPVCGVYHGYVNISGVIYSHTCKRNIGSILNVDGAMVV
jgi:hypothetical protein